MELICQRREHRQTCKRMSWDTRYEENKQRALTEATTGEGGLWIELSEASLSDERKNETGRVRGSQLCKWTDRRAF